MPTFNNRDKVRLKANPGRTGFIRNRGAGDKTYGVRMDDLDKTEWHGADALELIPMGEPAFSVGEMVRLRTNLAQQGAILASQYLHNGFQHHVFFGPNNQGWYPETSLLPVDDTPRAIDGGKFLRDLALIKLRSNLSDTLYSYRATRTNVEPYQFKPAMKFFESPNHRLFIADEVGLGKTIEAGIIYLELKARNDDLNRVLVVCPSGLRYKWKDEMFNRFNEEFTVVENAAAFKGKLENYRRFGDAEKFKAIVSMETIRQRGNAALIEEVGLTLDLVIIDEAHHMRNSNTLTHRVGRTLSGVSDAMLMLSATPIQLRSEDMFNQFRILDEGEFEDFQVFEQLREPNIHINRASQMLSTDPSSYAPALEELHQVEQTTQRERYVKNPFYLNIRDRLANPANPGHKELVELRRDLQKINTFASVFNRTTKKDVSSGVMRDANVIHVDLTEEEKSFYNAVMEHSLEQSGILASIQRERQVASCMSAAREYFADLVQDATADIHAEASDPDTARADAGREEDDDEVAPQESVQQGVDDLQGAGNQLGNTDSKFAMFIDAMNRLREESPDSKVLVFATFRRTIDYLRQSLNTANSPYAGSVYMMHGGVPQQERLQIIDRFKASDGFGILLLSEVGSEGMDFQFCDTVFNYDLPWNPMRVEQRIGRVDRYGQKSEKVKVYSLVLNDTIENRILERLYDRINVFEESIGDLEVILGDEIFQLQKEIFQSKLTPEQQVARTERMLRTIENKRIEAEEFSEEQDRFMGQDIIFQQQFDQVRNGGRFISEAEVKALVEDFIKEACPDSTLTPNPRNAHLFSLRGGRDLQPKIAGNWSLKMPPAIKAP
ncbi:MAG: DEAD/DEAH box helicase [Chloroflexi bacterium]|nr:DEAD/DEAH box helicase [Chloroflexota bacterium]